MPKRGMNIYKRKDGRWEGRIRQNTTLEGEKKYRSVYGNSYGEVRQKMILLSAEQGEGRQKCPLTVRQVVDLWIKDKKDGWKPSTYSCYRQLIERHIYKGAGSLRADTFTNTEFAKFLEGIKKGNDGSKISPSYARNIGSVIRQAFNYAAREYHYNLPVLEEPKKGKAEKRLEIPPDGAMDKLKKYLLAHTEDATCTGILIAYYTGIRIGELCALTWGDIDFEEGLLRINKNMQRIKDYRQDRTSTTQVMVQSPKTAYSLRSIPLPDVLLRILKENRKSEEKYLIEGKKKNWAETRTLQYRFAAILKACGVEHFKFHMLRHYFASLCMRQGFDLKSLSEILGHANTQITMNLYVHSSMPQKRLLMNKVFQEDAA